jgi:hypothetical protein
MKSRRMIIMSMLVACFACHGSLGVHNPTYSIQALDASFDVSRRPK